MSLLAALLQTDRHLTAAELQTRVEGYPEDKVAFRRAFERDKDELRKLGIPLDISKTETAEASVDAYRVLDRDYYLHDLGLDPDETVALAMALRLIRLEGASADDALWKLGGAVDSAAPAELGAIAMGPAVMQVHEAIRSVVSVQFEYRDELRLVEPWRLEFRRGHWYLSGYDTGRQGQRRFRLDRIEGALDVLADRPASMPRTPDADERQPWEFGDEAVAHTALVAVDATHAGWVRQQLGTDAVIEQREDGSVVVQLEVNHVANFRSFVLGLLDAAEVLSPPELRADVVRWLEQQEAMSS